MAVNVYVAFTVQGNILDAFGDVGNKCVAFVPALPQFEFNELMLRFDSSGDQAKMNEFVCSCMDERVVRIERVAKSVSFTLCESRRLLIAYDLPENIS